MASYLLWLALAGLVGGLLAGMLGVGGGLFFLLILPDALLAQGVTQPDLAATVVANSLLGTLVSALAATSQHLRQKTQGLRDIAWMGGAAAITAYIFLQTVVSQPFFNVRVFSSIVIAVLSLLFVRTVLTFLKEARNLTASSGKEDVEPKAPVVRLATIGGLAGMVSSLTGLGGGVLMVPFMRSWLGYPIRRAAFISSGAIVVSSLSAFYFSLQATPLFHIQGAWGYIVPAVALPLSAGVVVGAPLGVRVATRMGSQTLTLIYLFFLALIIVRRLFDFW